MTSPVFLLRYSQDLATDSRFVARYIGNLEDGRSNVSVNSSLTVGDQADYFRFNMTADGLAKITTGEVVNSSSGTTEAAKDGTVRYQLLSPSGRVVADSDPNAGAAFESWQKFTGDANLQLAKGSYTLRVARGKESVNATTYIYSFTMKSGQTPITASSPETASREFLTTERPPDPTAANGATYAANTNVTAVLGLFADVTVF
jgi:hypothetical protein